MTTIAETTTLVTPATGGHTSPRSDDDRLTEAIWLKTHLLVEGVNVDPDVELQSGAYKQRVEAIYHHHQGQPPSFRVPQEVVLHRPSAATDSEPILAQIRFNRESRWRLSVDPAGPLLSGPGTTRHVEFLPPPAWYAEEVADGEDLWRVVQILGTDLAGVVSSNYCAYFSTREQCRFCEIMDTYSDAREYKKSIKPDDVQIRALSRILEFPEVKYVAFTTGNYDVENTKTVEHLVHILSSVPGASRTRNYAYLMPPNEGALTALREAGFTALGLNMEVWREELFPVMVPGKASHVGRSNLIEILKKTADLYGRGNAYSNFVFGIQSLNGLDSSSFSMDREVEICLEATDALLDIGVLPLFTTYHTDGSNPIGPILLDPETTWSFYREYGKRVFDSGVVPPERNSVIYGLGSIANHPFNDCYYLAKCQAAQ